MDRRILMVVVFGFLAGCATPSGGGAESAEREAVPSQLDTDPRAKAIYQVMVGELAGQRGQNARAAEAYAEAAQASSSPPVAERAARIAVYAGRDELARRSAERWQALAPDDANPRRLLALLALRQGDVDKAYDHLAATLPDASEQLEQALAQIGSFVTNEAANETGVALMQRFAETYPGERMAHYVTAQLAMEAGDTEAAIEAADAALERSPQWQAARLIRVRAQLQAGRNDDAIDGLEALVADNPGDYDLRLQLARTLADQGRGQSALQEFDRIVEARPDNAQALYAGALVALEQQANDRAQRWLERLLAMGERQEAARYYLGRLAERRGDYAEARDQYSRTGGAYDHQAQMRLALMEGAEGAIDDAIGRLERLRENNPDFVVQAWQAQGQLLRNAGRLDAAVKAYGKGLEKDAGNTDLLYARAMTHVERDDIEAAERDLRAVLEENPGDPNALNALGYTLADNTDRYAEAEALIREAYDKLPESAAVVDSMGWIAYKQGRLEQAERYLRRAYEISQQGEIAAHLGEVLWQRGQRDEARRIWDQALQAGSNVEVVRETMERLTP